MKRILASTALVAVSAGMASAGGIERTAQSVGVLFEEGNHAEISFGFASPEVSGTSLAIPGAVPALEIGNVANDFTLPSAAIKVDLNDKISAALIYDRPFGADVAYDPANPILGGTVAEANTNVLTALLKYQITPRFSAYGGIRRSQAEGEITLQGAAYGPTSGYNVKLDSATGTGYVLGAAYEVPDIALRVALTYSSDISHDMGTTETGPLIDPDGPGPAPALPLLAGTSETEVKTPESWTLDFQTGISADTLLFGSIRHVKHSQFRVDPEQFVAVTGGGLIDQDDTTTYRLGVGRRFTDKMVGSLAIAYEAPGDELVSPLAPSTGYTQLSVGMAYDVADNVTLSGGISYTWLGDAKPETGTPDTARAEFEDNNNFGIGFKIAYKF